ncbi:MAG: erythromycin esterase family protein [Ferruginibacter sp.]
MALSKSYFPKFLNLSLLLISITSNAQTDTKDRIINNAVQLNITNAKIDPKALQQFGEAIGDSKIVMLGEQDHGDGSTFLVKAELIKYLHEVKGFNVLAFETDIFSMNYAWEEVIQNKISIDSAIKTSIFPIWTNCKECVPTFEYINQMTTTPSPIILTGFDNQLLFKSAFKRLKPELIKYLAEAKIDFISTQYFANVFPSDIDSLLKIFRFNRDNKLEKILLLQKMVDTLKVITSQLMLIKKQSDYFFLILENCISYCEVLLSVLKNENDFISGSIRDRQMANNLIWLIKNKFQNNKIIVWAANSHIVKSYTPQFNTKFAKAPSMGSIIASDSILKETTYVLGFTGYSGTYGRATISKEYKISKPKSNSLEYWLHDANFNDCFINFNLMKLTKEQFYMNCFNWRDYKLDWQNYYDGMIYLENIEPCSKINLIR